MHRVSGDGEVWEIYIPPTFPRKPSIEHGSIVKFSFKRSGYSQDRIPAWIKRAVPTKYPNAKYYEGIFWNPSTPYQCKSHRPKLTSPPKIYESHVGICTPEPKVSTYSEFTRHILPRVKNTGYNCIQLMAIMEHGYYPSFGYLVTNFFASSSRFGTPEELKELIDTAHGMGIVVLLDVVHSHAGCNILDGLDHFDGTPGCYFHDSLGRGYHNKWGTRLFDYSKDKVLQFLLSNLRFWVEEYRFDGFRFDGVTSMIYHHHGDKDFKSYHDYFDGSLDPDACIYLQLVPARV